MADLEDDYRDDDDAGAAPQTGWGARLQLLWRCPGWFAWDWLRSRTWRYLLVGLPAPIAALALAYMLLAVRLAGPAALLASYQRRADAAVRAGETATAEIYLRRLAQGEPAPPAAEYGLALLAARQNDLDRARGLMQRLAPEDGPGYAAAHLWLAKDLLQTAARQDPEAEKRVLHHLTQAVARIDSDSEAQALLGELRAKRGETAEAILHLEAARRQRPGVELTLAGLYEQQKNPKAARACAERARAFFQEQAKQHPESWPLRLQWAYSEATLKNYREALQVLQQGATAQDPQVSRAAITRVYLAWLATVAQEEPGNLPKRLEILNAALVCSPDDPNLLTLLADLSGNYLSGTDLDGAAQAKELLQRALARGVAPATVHALLGTQALERGEHEKAITHLELAQQGNPQMPAILNNLAWALANREKPDLERALRLAQAARKLSAHPEISHTIGSILARLGKQREAVQELEAALRSFPERPDLHAQLADLYGTLGDAELAELHRRQAKRKAAPAPARTPVQPPAE